MSTTLVVGGYGNAGREITRLLLAHSEHTVRVGGRHRESAEQLRGRLISGNPGWHDRIETVTVDATSGQDLAAAAAGTDLVIVAAGTSATGALAAQAAISAGADYLDIQVSAAKTNRILALDATARSTGRTLVTDGGFHPGVPAAMIRLANQRHGNLVRAVVGSVIAVDWNALSPLAESTVAEFVAEFRDFSYEEYRAGSWATARKQAVFTFPEPFGRRKAAAMGLAEMHELTAGSPALEETGFYVGGFNPVVDYGLIPVAWAGMRVAPDRLERPLGQLLLWGLQRFCRPPYGTILQLDGNRPGEPSATLMRMQHPDAYLITAAPAVAAALQLLDGSARRPGAHTQAMVVEPERFFADQVAMGIEISWLGAPFLPQA